MHTTRLGAIGAVLIAGAVLGLSADQAVAGGFSVSVGGAWGSSYVSSPCTTYYVPSPCAPYPVTYGSYYRPTYGSVYIQRPSRGYCGTTYIAPRYGHSTRSYHSGHVRRVYRSSGHGHSSARRVHHSRPRCDSDRLRRSHSSHSRHRSHSRSHRR